MGLKFTLISARHLLVLRFISSSLIGVMGLSKLPAEILVKILLNLDFRSVILCQGVNHSLRRLYQSSAELQYHVECEVAGVEDNPHCLLSIKTRLQLLRDRELAWTSPQHVQLRGIPPPFFDINFLSIDDEYLFVGQLTPTPYDLSILASHPIPPLEDRSTDEPDILWSVLSTLEIASYTTCLAEHDLVVFLIA